MITQFMDRQGFSKSLTGVSGSAIASPYHKPVMEPLRAISNVSWLPYPYGPLPDQGPWSNDKQEQPVTPEKPPGGTGDYEIDKPTLYGGGVMIVLVVLSAWFLVKYIPK